VALLPPRLEVGDVAVIVVAASAHREAAFDACRFVIEEIKRRVPIWKREWYADGSADWVNPAAAGTGNPPEEVAIGSAGGRHG